MTKEARSKTSYSVDPALQMEFAIECIRRKVSQSDAINEAIHLWLRPPPLAIPKGNDRWLENLMDIVNNPRNEAEKYLRSILKSAVNLRYISDDPIVKRNSGG